MTAVCQPANIDSAAAVATPSADAERAAGEAEDHRLHEELAQDVAARRADGLADADLARALGDGHQHDVHDPDAADDEADARDAREQEAEDLRRLLLRREELAAVEQREVVVAAGREAVLAAQHALDLDHRRGQRAAGRDLRRDRLHFLGARDPEPRGAERDVDVVVRVAEAHCALAPVDADHLERHVLHDDRRADEARRRDLRAAPAPRRPAPRRAGARHRPRR